MRNNLKNYETEELVAELERRKKKVSEIKREVPEIIAFHWYLTGDGYSINEIQETFEYLTGVPLDLDLAENIYDAFYEIKFDCTLNTKNGDVIILGISK